MRADRLLAASLGVAAALLAGRPEAWAGGAAARPVESAGGTDGLGPLAAELLATAHRLTGLPVPDRAPPVLLTSADTLAGLACGGRCRGVGVYLPGRGVLLDRELDPAGSVRGRALLLHELVLYALESARADPELRPCVRYQLWERTAYAAQHAYLEAAGSSLVTIAGPQRWLAGCGGPPVSDRPAEVASR